jgi:hypothetical protein
VKLVTELILKIVSLAKPLLSNLIPVSLTCITKEKKPVTKLVQLILIKLLVKTSVNHAVKAVMSAIKLTKVNVLPVTVKLLSLKDNATSLVQKDSTWVNKLSELKISKKVSVCLVVTDVKNVMMIDSALVALQINTLTLKTQVCVFPIVLYFQIILVLLTIISF